MANLVNLLEIKEFLKIKLDNDSEDDRLSSINTFISQLIESYCGRVISANTYTEYYDGGVSSVFIRNPPIVSVHEVAHFNGESYISLGGPGPSGEQIEVEGFSHLIVTSGTAKTSKRVKKYGSSSLLLNGSTDYISIASSSDFNFEGEPFTLECYVRPKTLSNSSIISRSDDAENYWELGYDETAGLLFKSVVNNVETNIISGATLTANTFTHIALVRSDSSFKFYKDGTHVGTAIFSSNTVPSLNSSLEIGRINHVDSKYFNGYIDELRVSWIDRYSTNFSPLTYPFSSDEYTKLLLHFNEGADKTDIYDFSRKVNDFIWYSDSGEITFDSGLGSGNPKLGFFNPRKFNNYTKGIKVSYTGGFSSVPSDLKLAALEMIKVIYKGRDGTKSVRLQGDDSTSLDLSLDGFPPQVRRVLNLYRLPI